MAKGWMEETNREVLQWAEDLPFAEQDRATGAAFRRLVGCCGPVRIDIGRGHKGGRAVAVLHMLGDGSSGGSGDTLPEAVLLALGPERTEADGESV